MTSGTSVQSQPAGHARREPSFAVAAILASTTILAAGTAHGEFYDSIAAWRVAVGGPVTGVGFHEWVGTDWALPMDEFYGRSHGLHMVVRRNFSQSTQTYPLYAPQVGDDWFLMTQGAFNEYLFLTLSLDIPIRAIAFEKSLRRATIFAYWGDTLVATYAGVPGTGQGAQGLLGYGMVFDHPVDLIRFEQDEPGDLSLSGLQWSTVPAPGALALLALAPFAARRRVR